MKIWQHSLRLVTGLVVLTALVWPMGVWAQQTVYHRDNCGTGNWWDGANPWYYQTWNNTQDRPDRNWRTANDVFRTQQLYNNVLERQ